MEKIEKFFWIVTQGAIAFLAVLLCVKLCTGCTFLKTVGHSTVASALKTAYTEGGAVAVSNRIEQLVVDGKVTPAQATALHAMTAKLGDAIVEKLDAEIQKTTSESN